MARAQRKVAVAATGIVGVAFAVLITVASSGCDVMDPSCQRSLEETWRVSSGYRGEVSWCRGLCSFEGKSFDEVTKTSVGGAVLLSCYCCS